MRKRIGIFATALLSISATGCTLFFSDSSTKETVTSSLVDYLYPNGDKPTKPEGVIPRLELPLRVGIAFVPVSDREGGGYLYGSTEITEATRTDMLEVVKASFVERDYIDHIEVIPQTYLQRSGGFDGLTQIARLYDVDVMALVSYDQVSTSTDNAASLLYWTIVGAYVIPGTSNMTQTFVDTAVFDVDSQRLLFRAPGTDSRKRLATAVGNTSNRASERTKGMRLAVDDMTANLATELDSFEERLKNEPTLAEVQWREGTGGGGALNGLLLLAGALWLVRRRRSGRRL